MLLQFGLGAFKVVVGDVNGKPVSEVLLPLGLSDLVQRKSFQRQKIVSGVHVLYDILLWVDVIDDGNPEDGLGEGGLGVVAPELVEDLVRLNRVEVLPGGH